MKKISAIILSIIMIITLFSGCGKDAANEKTSNKEAKSEVVAKNKTEDKKGETKDEKTTEIKPEEKDETTKEEGSAVSSLEGGSENTFVNEEAQVNSNGGNQSSSQETPKPEVSTPEIPVAKYVTLSITCNTILNNMDKVSEGKKAIIPSNGVILGEIQVEIKDGDTVFDVLKKETRNNRIHMDFVETPVYGSAYIKGIANIYEFDAGDLSGWMYSVNGLFPGFGVSQYDLQNGDKIEFKYTCDLGKDL